MRKTIEFEIPTPPSLKNGMAIGRGKLRRGEPVRLAMRQIRAEAEAAAIAAEGMEALEHPLFDDDDVAVEIDYHPRNEVVVVRVTSAGPRPKKFTGRKRDLQNLQDGILDALQGVLYANDNQVADLKMRRIL